ncbi:MAG: AbrB/MazE/SpoVT family DNA-binding domain-containing protein, partial [Chloroflexota bacterium]|nr:AbrB/MazE/SpoVT family DNA-binding domain-containing protein [Chloroflexota bacterium]
MDIKVNAKRQATIPARALEALSVNPGDCLEVTRGPDVIVLRVKRENSGDTGVVAGKIDYSMYGTLRD